MMVIGIIRRQATRLLRLTAVWLGLLLIIGQSAAAQSDFFKFLQYPFYDPNSSSGCYTILSGKDNAEKTWNYFIGKGLTPAQTAGILGNLMQESHFNPVIMQGGGESQNPADADPLGWGLIQWTPGSKVINQAKQAGIRGPIYELSTQLDLVWQHMHNNPIVTQRFDLNHFKNINNEVDASLYFLVHIEGGTNPGGIREKYATEILNQYGSVSASQEGGGTSVGCSTAANGECSVSQPVYNEQYSQQQLANIFGNPGTASNHPDLGLVDIAFLGKTATINSLVAPCLKAVAQQIEAQNINYKIKQFGCYRFDSDNGSSNIGLKSYHTYGAACDINWDTNPWSGSGPSPYDMPQAYVQAFHDHGFTWGGNWRSVKDYMHFEWHGVVPQ